MSELTSNAIVVGDASDDTLSGGSFAGSIMHGQNGADSMTGGFGDDTLIGAAGDDILEGGGGADVLYGGIGDDFLIYGADSLQGGGPEMVRMFGGEGQDALFLNFSNDVLSNPDLLLEIKDYSLALQAGEDPGDGGEYAFENFALRVSSVEVVFLFIDGQAFDPALPPVPVAFDDAFTMADNAPLDGDVSGNDNVPLGAAFTLDAGPQSGELTFNNDGTFTFDPLGDFIQLAVGETAEVTFSYSLSLSGAASSTATATITVEGANEAPEAEDGSFEIPVTETFDGAIAATDPDGDALTFTLLSTGLAGDFTLNPDGTYSYVAPGVVGTETVDVLIEDPFGGDVTVQLTFEATDGPEFLGPVPAIRFQTAEANQAAANSFDAATLFNLPGAGPFFFEAAGLPSGVAIDSATGEISGVPANEANGLFEATITVTDAGNRSASGPLTIASADSFITGDAEDNELIGDAFSNFIEGGPGNDYLQGGDEPDIYRYTAGDGFDVILDNTGNDADTLLLSGYTLDQLSFSRYSGGLTDLLITPIGQEGTFVEGVLIREGIEDGNQNGQIAQVKLDDGTVLTTADLRALVLAGESAADRGALLGVPTSNDVINSGPGPDTLSGLTGSDTYVFEVGDGADIVRDNGSGSDTAQFVGRALTDATISAVAGTADLLIDFGGGDSILFERALNGSNAFQIETFIFTDQTLTVQDIRQLLLDQNSTAGDDVIFAPNSMIGREVIEGGPGDDTLVGSGDNDTYVYRAGDGFDAIGDNGNINTANTLEIHGFTLTLDPVTGDPTPGSQVQFSQRIPGDQTIRILLDNGNPGEQGGIDLLNGLTRSGFGDRFSTITFVDQGLTLTTDEVREIILNQLSTDGDDVIFGFNVSPSQPITDTIDAGTGDDFVNGRAGSDTFVFNAGDDRLTIHDFSTAGTETLLLPDLTLAQLEFERDRSRDSEDLLITNTADAGDLINWRGLLVNLSAENDRIEDSTGARLTSSDLRDLILAQDIAAFITADTPGIIRGFDDHADTFAATPGLDATLLGSGGSDTYTITATDGRDTIRDTAIIGTDTVILQGINVADFDPQQGGTMSVLTNTVLTSDVTLRFDAENSLTIHNFGGIESFVFDDATIAKADFVANFVTPFEIESPEITGSGGGTVTGSTAAQEVFRVGSNDTIEFTGGQIGDDIITSGFNQKYSINLTLDGAWAGASVTFQRSILSNRDFTIIIDNGVDPYETIQVDGTYASFEGNSKLLDLNISDDGVARPTITGNEIYQVLVDNDIAAGEDRVIGTDSIGEVFDAAPGDRFYQGLGGNDTYLYTVGDGRAIFNDGGFRNADQLIVTGYNIADATLRRDFSGDFDVMVIDFGDDEIVLPGIFNFGNGRVDTYDFDDTVDPLTTVELIQLFLDQQHADPDVFQIIGSDTADTLISAGDRYLLGAQGQDIYQITDATTETWIEENGFREVDTIILPVASDEVIFRQDPTDRGNLIIDFDAGGRVLIINGYSSVNGGIENYQFTDTTLTRVQTRDRVQTDLQDEDNNFRGFDFTETIEGGAGDDSLLGGNGADIYRYSRGDGHDFMEDTGFRNDDTLEISGFQLEELNFFDSETGNNALRITFDGEDGSIVIGAFLRPSNGNSIENIRLVDDVDPVAGLPAELLLADVRQLVIEQQVTTGDDRIEGFADVDDTIAGGGGADTLVGGTGSDTYVFNSGDGVVFIDDQGRTPGSGEVDTVIFNGVALGDVTARRLAANHEDVVFEFNGSTDRVIVSNRFIDNSSGSEIESFVFDQTTLSLAELYDQIDNGIGVGGGPAPAQPTPGGFTGGATAITGGSMATPPAGEAISGDGRDNLLSGGEGADTIRSHGGDDTLKGLNEDDRLIGGGGADRVAGGEGADTLLGGGGRDVLNGGADDDLLNGGRGADRLRGGEGADTFVFTAAKGIDRVLDFEDGADQLKIGGADAFGDLTITDAAAGARVVFGDITVIVKGVQAGDLDAADFIF